MSVQKAGCPSVCVMAEFFWPLALATGSMHTRFENAMFAFVSQLMAMCFCNEKIYDSCTNKRTDTPPMCWHVGARPAAHDTFTGLSGRIDKIHVFEYCSQRNRINFFLSYSGAEWQRRWMLRTDDESLVRRMVSDRWSISLDATTG